MQDKKKCKSRLALFFAAGIFLVVLILTTIVMVSSAKTSSLAFGPYRYYVMDTSSYPNIAQRGDLIVAKKTNIKELKKGDSIVHDDGKYYYCNDIVEIKQDNSETKVIIAGKGDVKYRVSEKYVSGKVVKVIPMLGAVVSFQRTILGIIITVLCIICIHVLLRIAIAHDAKEKCKKNS